MKIKMVLLRAFGFLIRIQMNLKSFIEKKMALYTLWNQRNYRKCVKKHKKLLKQLLKHWEISFKKKLMNQQIEIIDQKEFHI